MILLLGYRSRETIRLVDAVILPLRFRGELDLVKIIEPVMHSLKKTRLLMGCGRTMITI